MTKSKGSSMEVEYGAPLCANGKIVLGKISKGTRNRVVVDLKCPKGMKAVGTIHSHPGSGDRAYLSTADITNLRRARLKIGCVTSGKITRCFRIKRK